MAFISNRFEDKKIAKLHQQFLEDNPEEAEILRLAEEIK
jgi:hypothetical protein